MSIIPPNVETITIAISRGRTGVEQPVLGLLPVPSVPRRRGVRDLPRPHRRGTAGAWFAPSAVCSAAARGGTICRGRTGVEQPVLGLLPVPSAGAAPP